MLSLKYKNKKYEIDESLNICILSKDINYVDDFLKKIAGINKSDVLLDGINVYDNEDYFKNRIYIDNTKSYINTLNSTKIEELLLNEYFKVFNKEEFDNLVKKCNLRFNYNFLKRNRFDNLGKSLVNNIFCLSLMNFRIIYKAFNNINDDIYFDYISFIKDEYRDKKNNLFGDSISNIKYYKDLVDKIIVLNNKLFILDAKSNVLLVEGKLSCQFEDEIIYEHNNHFYYRIELLKNLDFLEEVKKTKYRVIDVYSIGDDYE